MKTRLNLQKLLPPSTTAYNRLSMYAIWVSIVGNATLFVAKYWVGVASESVAIQADAWHTISDTLSSMVVLLGLQLAKRPPDRVHPFGHGRYELLSTMMVGIMLGAVAIFFGYEGVKQLLQRRSADFGLAAIIVTLVSVAAKELMGQYAFWVAKRTGNSAIRADGWHHRSDALSSLLVLLGVLLGEWFWWVDGVLGIGVALLIAYVALTTIRRATSHIVGESPPEELCQTVTRLINETYPTLPLRPHEFRWHNYIRRQELTLHIELPPEMSVRQAFEITTHLEEKLKEHLSLEATVQVEPPTVAP